MAQTSEPALTMDQLRDANNYAESLQKLRADRAALQEFLAAGKLVERKFEAVISLKVSSVRATSPVLLDVEQEVDFDKAAKMMLRHYDESITSYEETMREFGVDPS